MAIVGSWCRFTLLDLQTGEWARPMPIQPGDPRVYADVVAEEAAKAEAEAVTKAEQKKKAKPKKDEDHVDEG